jgi:hypothetical protein
MAVIEERERHIVGGVDTHKDLHVAESSTNENS